MGPPGSMLGMPPPPTSQQPPGSMGGGYQPLPQLYGNAPTGLGMPSAFDSGNNLAAMGMMQPGGPTTPQNLHNPNPVNLQTHSMDPNQPQQQGQPGITGGAPLPLIEEMDLSIQCNPAFLRASVSKIVASQAQAAASRIPLGLICKPMAGDRGVTNDEIDVVDFGSTGIIRCKRCRTYINPFITWADNGRRWRCNICGMLNDVPSNYFSHLDGKGQRRDRDSRPELSRCSVEFVAPSDYMVRPPQPPVYFFVIDVSEASVASGMLSSMVAAIKDSIEELSNNSRCQIGFISFDSQVHFYNLKATLSAPQMLVVSDVADVILPLPDDLLVNLCDSKTVVMALLESLPNMFRSNSNGSQNNGGGDAGAGTCTGPALMAAKRVMQNLGGKLSLFQSSLPSIGEGALKMRENPRLLGTDREFTLLNAEDTWYKTNAIDFSRLQIAVDVYLFSPAYTDLATVSVLSKYTSGTTYYYPAFSQLRDGRRFEYDLHRALTRATAFEAVMRVRATRGIRFSNFYGNYFVRGTDLLALPNCTADSSFSLDMAYDEGVLAAQAITVQAALLYTSSAGERRIRVHTMVIPVTQSVTEMVESLDVNCAMNILSKQAVDIAQKTGMDNARSRVHQTTVEILKFAMSGGGIANQQMYGGMNQQYRGQYQQQQAAPAADTPLPASLLLLPLYSMSLQKCLVIRGGGDVRVDERAYFQLLLHNMDIDESKVFIYPRMFSIHDMGAEIGLPADNAGDEGDDCPTAGPFRVRLPSILNLTYERLQSDGIFLMENGHDLFMWIGRAVNPAILSTLFNEKSLENVDMTTLSICAENSDFSSRVAAVVAALRSDRKGRYMQLHFIREGDGYAEAYFARFLIEDRANFTGGNLTYNEYYSHLMRALAGLPG